MEKEQSGTADVEKCPLLSLPPALQTQELNNSSTYFQKYEIVVKVLSITAVWVIVGLLGGHRGVGSPLVKRNLSRAAVAFEKTLM